MKPSEVIVDKDLLERMKFGDQAAFEELYRQYSVEIYRRLLMMMKVPNLAEELTQDIFIRIWEKRALIEPTDSFKSYLYRLSKNMAIDYYRKIAREQRLQDQIIAHSSVQSNNTEETILFNETNVMFQNAIESLPPQQKQVFIMCKLEGKTYQEASELLGISTSTISNHIVTATKTLKKILGDERFFIFLFVSLFASLP